MFIKKLLAKKSVKKVILYSTLVKLMFTLAGLGFIRATGATLPQPLTAVETRIATVFQTNDSPARLSSSHLSKAGGSIQVM